MLSLLLVITGFLGGHQSLVQVVSFPLTTTFDIGEICSLEEDTNGGASLSSTIIDDDEGVSSLFRVICAAELVDTFGDLFSKYSLYIGNHPDLLLMVFDLI
nr:hypothetical protein [Tanacetum cinerariifolium]